LFDAGSKDRSFQDGGYNGNPSPRLQQE